MSKKVRTTAALEERVAVNLPDVAWDADLRPYLDACQAAYLNAVALKEEAALLFRNRRYARTAALAVTGLEEAGKSLILSFVGLGRIPPAHREKLLKALRWHHRMKQATALPLMLIGRLIPALRHLDAAAIPTPRRKAGSWDEIELFLRQAAPAILGSAQTIVQELFSDEPAIEEEAKQLVEGSLESQRQRALYTDVLGSAVHSPADVSRAEAAEVLGDLRACLTALKLLAAVATFDDQGVRAVLAVSALHERINVSAQEEPVTPPSKQLPPET